MKHTCFAKTQFLVAPYLSTSRVVLHPPVGNHMQVVMFWSTVKVGRLKRETLRK